MMAKSNPDRTLCPVAVASVLGLRVADVARGMRLAGETTVLTVPLAKAWKAGTVEMPDWLSALYAERLTKNAQREFARADSRWREEVAELTAEQRAKDLWDRGLERRIRAGSLEADVVLDWQWRLLKDTQDKPYESLTKEERRLLDWSPKRRRG